MTHPTDEELDAHDSWRVSQLGPPKMLQSRLIAGCLDRNRLERELSKLSHLSVCDTCGEPTSAPDIVTCVQCWDKEAAELEGVIKERDEARALYAEITAQPGVVSWCPTCGPEPRSDEDGCCVNCGADIGEVPDWRPLQAKLERVTKERDEGLEIYSKILVALDRCKQKCEVTQHRLDIALELAEDTMSYALHEGWEWKYGDEWRAQLKEARGGA